MHMKYFLLIATFCISEMNSSSAQQNNNKASPVISEQNSPAVQESVPILPFKEAEAVDIFNLSYYEPLYFVFGNPTSKVQLSFKYQFIRALPVFFGFNQNIFWYLSRYSHPFRDVNFNPKVFYRLYFHESDDDQDYLDFIPYEHKSNGQAEPTSRSWDGSGAKIHWSFHWKQWAIKSYMKAMFVYNLDPTNKDIREYTGPLEFGVSLLQFDWGTFNKGEVTYKLSTGGKNSLNFKRSGHELGFVFRLFGINITPAFYIQYFYGYSESLINYNKKEHNIRFGFML